jgi:carbon-monoxide dehydrogenase large subunit
MESRENRLIAGKGQFADDLDIPGMAHLVFVGSPHAHAKILSIDVSRALSLPGVIRVITGSDMRQHTKPLPVQANFKSPDWIWRLATIYAMPEDKVRWFGEPVAAVVAEDETTARIAADRVVVTYEPLPAVANPMAALEAGAPKLYDDWEDNKQVHLKFDWGDPDAAFAEADRVIQVSHSEGRVTGLPIEPRGCVAQYDPKRETLNMWGTFQTPYLARHNLAAALGIPEARVKVTAVDIGGAFGLKIHVWKENVVALASMLTGRPVKWSESLRDFITTGPHQRDVFWEGEVAVKNDGTLLGLRATVTHDLGVESTNKGIAALSIFPACSSPPNMYKWKGMHIEGIGVVTNKSFYCAYRGYGKDKGLKFIESVINRIARELGMTPEAIRFKNFIQPEEFPFHQINNYVMDSGDYPATLNKALEMADVDSWRSEQEKVRSEGRYIGVGLVTTIEPAGVAVPNCQMGGLTEARVQIMPDGTVEVDSDRTEIGQGSEISHTQIVCDILGCLPEDVYIRPVTSEWIGQGPLSSRGAVWPASAVAKAAKMLREKINRIAAHFLKAAAEDIEAKSGEIFVRNQPEKKLTFKALAEKAFFFPGPRGLPKDMLLSHGQLLDVTTTWYSPTTPESGSSYTTFCSSADIAIVEVDTETGVSRILKYVHVHDAGTVISHKVIDGQIHGGIVQGIGEALTEKLDYDAEGNLLNTSIAEYLMPTAVEAPEIEIAHLETPSPFSETGSKGMGEAPIIGSKAVILTAIEDALTPFGVIVNDSPATPERVLRWIREAQGERL